MFELLDSLLYLNLSNFVFVKALAVTSFLSDCKSLISIDLSNIVIYRISMDFFFMDVIL